MSYYDDQSSWFKDDSIGGTDNVPMNYKSNLVNIIGLSLFLIISLILLSINSIAAYNQYQHLTYVKLGYRPGLWSNTHTRLNLIQVLGSFLNMLNQIYFLLLELGTGLPFPLILGGIIYIAMLVCVSTVMENRSTTLLKGKNRRPVRIFMYILILIAILAIIAGIIFRSRNFNAAGKLCIALLYAWFIFVFIKPLYRHSRAIRNVASQQGNQTTKRLNDLVRTLFIKIVVCVGTLVFTTLLGTLHLFGRYTNIEFSIQNAVMVYASTLALNRFGRRRNIDGESTSGTASIMGGNEPDTPGVSRTLISSQKSNSYNHTHMIPTPRPSGPLPFASTPHMVNYGVSILTSTAASPLQVNGQFKHSQLIEMNVTTKPTLPYQPVEIIMDTNIPLSSLPLDDIGNTVSPTIICKTDNEISKDYEKSQEKSQHHNNDTEFVLRRVCSDVWVESVDEDNESTLINMAIVNSNNQISSSQSTSYEVETLNSKSNVSHHQNHHHHHPSMHHRHDQLDSGVKDVDEYPVTEEVVARLI